MSGAKRCIATIDMSLRGTSVAIVGGGIGGLTAALAFAKQGASVCVYEQAPAFSEVGAGIQITPNGGRVLAALGVGDLIEFMSIKSHAVVPVDGLTGNPIARFSLRDQVPPYRFVHRAKLIELLAGACDEREVALYTGRRVISARPDGHVTYQDADRGMPGDIQHDLVVFADGIHSIGRGLIDVGEAPAFTGQVAWRALIKSDMIPEARIWMGPGRHAVCYPLPGRLTNLVAVQERDEWAEEGWSHPDDPANLRAAFADFAPGLRQLLERVEEVNLWGLFRHPVAQDWSKGALVMLGDAAHPTLPFLAQGANLAMEDGYVLARCLARFDQKDGLAAYQKARKPRVERAIAAANANARNYHLDGRKRQIAHWGLRKMAKHAPNAFIGRLSWLYGHDVTR